MANIDAKLLEIQNNSTSAYTSFVLDSFIVEYPKLWTDADRNMDGDVRASMIGNFNKIVVKTRPLTKEEASVLANLLFQQYFNAKFYDVATNSVQTKQFYASDFSMELLSRGNGGWFNEVSFSLIPISRR